MSCCFGAKRPRTFHDVQDTDNKRRELVRHMTIFGLGARILFCWRGTMWPGVLLRWSTWAAIAVYVIIR